MGGVPLPEDVTDWTTVPEVAEELGISVTDVRQLLREGKLLAFREAPASRCGSPRRSCRRVRSPSTSPRS